LVILKGLLSRLSDSLVSSDVNNSPDSTLVLVSLEDVVNVLLQSQISLDYVDIASLLLLIGSVGRKSLDCEFRYALESSRERVVEAKTRLWGLA